MAGKHTMRVTHQGMRTGPTVDPWRGICLHCAVTVEADSERALRQEFREHLRYAERKSRNRRWR